MSTDVPAYRKVLLLSPCVWRWLLVQLDLLDREIRIAVLVWAMRRDKEMRERRAA